VQLKPIAAEPIAPEAEIDAEIEAAAPEVVPKKPRPPGKVLRSWQQL